VRLKGVCVQVLLQQGPRQTRACARTPAPRTQGFSEVSARFQRGFSEVSARARGACVHVCVFENTRLHARARVCSRFTMRSSSNSSTPAARGSHSRQTPKLHIPLCAREDVGIYSRVCSKSLTSAIGIKQAACVRAVVIAFPTTRIVFTR
jgi:hypothetical protein